MAKNDIRQAKILDLISGKEICSQEELALELKNLNFDVNQSTVSRDIKELGLIKVLMDNGKSKYVSPNPIGEKQRMSEKCENLFRHSVLSVDSSENLIVVKTLSGTANSAAMAIDKMEVAGILGSVAGDDTVLIVARSREDVLHITGVLNKKLHD